jgi:hypothetical protein
LHGFLDDPRPPDVYRRLRAQGAPDGSRQLGFIAKPKPFVSCRTSREGMKVSSTTFRSTGRFAALGSGIAVLSVALLSGCGGSASNSNAGGAATVTAGAQPTSAATGFAAVATTAAATTASGNFDSCSVVTQAQAASAIGESVSAGVLGTATVEGGLACVFYGPDAVSPKDPNVAQADTVRMVVVEGSDAAKWYNDYKSSPTVHARAISGYGDQAYYDGYASLSVMKGDAYIRISISPSGAAPSLSDEEKLMSAVLPGI